GGLLIGGLEDDARSPTPQDPLQRIPSTDTASHGRVLPERAPALQETTSTPMPREELGQVRIAQGGDMGGWIGRFECLGQALGEFIPPTPDHSALPWSCAYNYARAVIQSRLTVASEISRHCAISSFDRPPK